VTGRDRRKRKSIPRASKTSAQASDTDIVVDTDELEDARWFEIRGAPLTDKTTTEWLEVLQRADIAVKPCHTLETLTRDPHVEAVGLLQSDEHPTEGKTFAIRSTISFDNVYPPLPPFAQPRGWDTLAVLKDIYLSHAGKQKALKREGFHFYYRFQTSLRRAVWIFQTILSRYRNLKRRNSSTQSPSSQCSRTLQ